MDRIIGEVALKVFGTHAWYLTSEWAISVIFSRLIGIEERKELVNKLLSMPNQPVLRDRDKKSVYGKPQFPSINGMQNASDFIHPDSCFFFRVLKLDTSFLHTPVESWEQQSSYLFNRNVVKNLEVVNDSAERGVRLADYLSRTQIESKYQNVLQIVENDRHLVPDQRHRSWSSTRETWLLRFEENIV